MNPVTLFASPPPSTRDDLIALVVAAPVDNRAKAMITMLINFAPQTDIDRIIAAYNQAQSAMATGGRAGLIAFLKTQPIPADGIALIEAVIPHDNDQGF